MKYGHSYYTDDRTAPREVLERLSREHPTLVLAWNNAQQVWDVLAKVSDKGAWRERYAFIMSWMHACPICHWRRWQKVNCPKHRVVALSLKNEGLFTKLQSIKRGTSPEEMDAFVDGLEADDKAKLDAMERRHAEGRMEGARRAAVNLRTDRRLGAMPRSVKDLVTQQRKRIPIAVNGIRAGG